MARCTSTVLFNIFEFDVGDMKVLGEEGGQLGACENASGKV
jgi:hypothetical protein